MSNANVECLMSARLVRMMDLDNRKVTFQTDHIPLHRIAARFQWAYSAVKNVIPEQRLQRRGFTFHSFSYSVIDGGGLYKILYKQYQEVYPLNLESVWKPNGKNIEFQMVFIWAPGSFATSALSHSFLTSQK